MTWEIVLGIISLIGVFGVIAKAAANLTRTLATLETVIRELKETVQEFKGANGSDHKHFFKTLADHERRIDHLETINEIKGGESQ